MRSELEKLSGQSKTFFAKYSYRGQNKKMICFHSVMLDGIQVADHVWVYYPHFIKMYSGCEYVITGKIQKYFRKDMTEDYKIGFITKLMMLK